MKTKLGAGLEVYFNSLLDETSNLVSGVGEKTGDLFFASRLFSVLAGVPADISGCETSFELYPSILHARLRDLDKDFKKNTYDRNSPQEWELSVKHKDGSLHLYQMRRYRLENSDGQTEPVIVTIGMDVTDNKLAESALRDHKKRINYMTFHDSVTGLANRSLFYDRMNKSISRAKRSKSSLALMLIDLDRFKNINDCLGYDAGDSFLKKISERLLDDLRDTDTVARLGGDEFVVVLENILSSDDIERIAGKVLHSLSQPVVISGHEISTTASIGVSVYPNDGDSIDQLLKHADTAMYRAKAAGKNRFQFFISAMRDTAVNYLLLENDLRRAIEQEELVLFYQPQVDLHTGRIVGLEALVRWNHRDRGLVSPMHFIPLAEETGLIRPLGEWVLNHACERFHAWLMNGINFGKIAVNLSTRQFREEHFEQTVVRVLTETRLSPQYLELEITESSAMENAAQTIEMLKCLSNMGLSLAIDDFGTGYSSLAYLQKFPIQKLKIDRSFIQDIDTNSQDAAIAKSIIDLAHNMSLQVIAEGVERPSQSRWLFDRGCDQVQGYYYSKPLSEEQLMELVNDDDRVVRDVAGIRIIA